MIQRRQFLGSMAALGVAATSNSLFGAIRQTDKLNWECQIIKTVAHNDARRDPVVTCVSRQNNGDLLAIVGDDHFVCLYDVRRQSYLEHLDRHQDWIRSTAFSSDGTKLVTAGNDRTLCLWNVGQWEEPAIVKRHPEAVIHTLNPLLRGWGNYYKHGVSKQTFNYI